MSIRKKMKKIPTLEKQSRIMSPKMPSYDPKKSYKFYYESRGHARLPHVVKFSGGRSSGMLLFVLLENGFLDPQRGDVVVFNNTSAEHPATYEFAAKCKEITEKKYGVPFFWTEFQTYEDAVGGEWVRIPSYKLVNSMPYSKDNPNGYKSHGEVFEEMLSHLSYIPNQHQRVCTATMKIRATSEFLKDWFTGKETIARCGHYYGGSQMTKETVEKLHHKHGGKTPIEVLMEKKAFIMSCPSFRPEQKFADFTAAKIDVSNGASINKGYGKAKLSGDGCVEYLSFIGFRADEHPRVVKMYSRNQDDEEENNGEYMYAPLSKMGVSGKDVNEFWNAQSWGLSLPDDVNMSNCVFCFLKGAGNILAIADRVQKDETLRQNGGLSPTDIKWWVDMEKKYGRDLKREGRVLKDDNEAKEQPIIGFFGMNSKVSFDVLAQRAKEGKIPRHSEFNSLPCNCTD